MRWPWSLAANDGWSAVRAGGLKLRLTGPIAVVVGSCKPAVDLPAPGPRVPVGARSDGSGASATPGAPGHDSVLVARQPILSRSRRLFGYELLFRSTASATSADAAGEVATAQVITAAVSAFGLDVLTCGHRAFINVTRPLLIDGIPTVLPRGQVVLELLESVEADDEVLDACRQLRSQGYTLALDDFALSAGNAALVPLADIIKVDALATPLVESRQRIVAARGPRPVALLAEKVETVEQFDEAVSAGYDYFQGYFFGRPVMRTHHAIPGHHLAYLRLLQVLHNPNSSHADIETVIKHDASMCLRLLRTANSAAFGQRSPTQSIGRAILLLGRQIVSRWASIWILAGVAGTAHEELLRMSIVRARCCELLAETHGEDYAADGFLLGMCSLLDAILECPMPEILSEVPLSDSTRAALGGDGNVQRRLLDCVIAYERGEWTACAERAAGTGIDLDQLSVAHRDALSWAREFDHLDKL